MNESPPAEDDEEHKAFEDIVEEYIADMETPAPVDALKVVVSPKAVAEMLNHALNYYSDNTTTSTNHEVMGLLIGWEIDEKEIYVYRTYPVTHGSAIGVQFRDEHFKVFENLDLNEDKGEFVLGWYHSHPGLGVFLSAIDINTHASSFQGRNPKSIAIVIDPAEAPKDPSKWNSPNEMGKVIKAFQVKSPSDPLKSKYYTLPLTLKRIN
ncbi:MAG: Mov34/MPN/PAD-1 family protein [Candidatus Ranarchaeia archaeon]